MRKERFTLVFSPETYAKPVTYHLVKDYDLKINILKAVITPGEEGHLLVEMEGEDGKLTQALDFLRREQITVIPTTKQLVFNKDACVHCGACTAVCFSGAMVMNRQTWEVEFKPEQCIVCRLCIHACPLKLISSGFGTKDEYTV